MRCPILTNHNIRKNGTCRRYTLCLTQGRADDPRCQALGGPLYEDLLRNKS